MVLPARMIPPALNTPPCMRQLLLPGTASLKGPSGSCADLMTCFLQTGGQRREGQTEGSTGITRSRSTPPAPLVAHPPAPGAGPHHLLLNEGPDDSCHLIPVHLHHRICHLDPLVGIWRPGGVLGVHPWSHSSTPLCGARASCGDHTAPSSQVRVPAWLRDRYRSGASPAGVWASYWGQPCWSGGQSAERTM